MQRYVHDPFHLIYEGRPPPIADAERILPRKTKLVMEQLISGWSNRLNAFWNRIDRAIPNLCPAYGQGSHHTPHIFNSLASSTPLCPRCLCTALDLAEPRIEFCTLFMLLQQQQPTSVSNKTLFSAAELFSDHRRNFRKIIFLPL